MTIGKFIFSATLFLAAFMLGSCTKDDEDVYDGPEYIDMWLPSGTLWATRNIGASKPEDFGYNFAWGETKPKDTYSFTNYKWGDGTDPVAMYESQSHAQKRYSINYFYERWSTKYNTADKKSKLEPEDDAATANWGSGWCMPSEKQIEELLKNTTRTWIIQNGVYGVKLTSKINGESIFLPATIDSGRKTKHYYCLYWSCENGRSYIDAYCLNIGRKYAAQALGDYNGRIDGIPVRPVRCNK